MSISKMMDVSSVMLIHMLYAVGCSYSFPLTQWLYLPRKLYKRGICPSHHFAVTHGGRIIVLPDVFVPEISTISFFVMLPF